MKKYSLVVIRAVIELAAGVRDIRCFQPRIVLTPWKERYGSDFLGCNKTLNVASWLDSVFPVIANISSTLSLLLYISMFVWLKYIFGCRGTADLLSESYWNTHAATALTYKGHTLMWVFLRPNLYQHISCQKFDISSTSKLNMFAVT